MEGEADDQKNVDDDSDVEEPFVSALAGRSEKIAATHS